MPFAVTDRSQSSLTEQLERLHRELAEQFRCSAQTPEQLWTWQQTQIAYLRDALLLHWSAVYRPPYFQPERNSKSGFLETENRVWIPLRVHSPTTAWNHECVVWLEEGRTDDCALVADLTAQGSCVFSIPSRAAVMQSGRATDDPAAEYLRVGRTYLGSCVLDCIRLIDYIESHVDYAVETVGLYAAGESVQIAAAVMAMDKRIRGAVLQPAETESTPRQGVPWIVGGGWEDHVMLALQCCVPRGVLWIGEPHKVEKDFESLGRLYRLCDATHRFAWGIDERSISEQSQFLHACLI